MSKNNQVFIQTTYFKTVNTLIINSNTTYTPSAGTKAYRVEVIGSGGGGAGCASTTSNSGGGGGGGGYSQSYFETFPLPTGVTVTIGTGGTGGAAGLNNGSQGSTTSFGAYISVPGGEGGISRQHAGATAIDTSDGGAGSLGTGGDSNKRGCNGGNGYCYLTGASLCLGGSGGGGYLGLGARIGVSAVATLTTDANTGAGGAGSAGANLAGANGSDGLVIITEYIQ
jgi:hypothetical protein